MTEDTVIARSIAEIEDRLEGVDTRVFTENEGRVVLEVLARVEDIEEYERVKSVVREIVRSHETEDMMVYTRIRRKIGRV